MDIARSIPKRRVTGGLAVAATAITVLVLALLVLSFRRSPAVVERSEVTMGTVEEGPLVRQVRGHGSFISREVRVVGAPVGGRVARVLQQVGATVTPATPLVELTSPEVEQAEADAKLAYDAAVSGLAGHRADLRAKSLERQSAYRALKVDEEDAKLRADIATKLAKEGVGTDLDRQLLDRRAANLHERLQTERERLEAADSADQAQLRSEENRVAQLRSLWLLKRSQREALRVTAGQEGVLQELSVQPGQTVAGGAPIGRIIDPRQLMVRAAVAEADARQIVRGEPATIEVDGRFLPGRVTRVDPSVSNGNVSLDIELSVPVPASVRPDLTVEATIDFGRIADTLKVARPANVAENSTANIFVADGPSSARRTPVRFGRASVSEIEVLAGAPKGSRILLSVPDRLDGADRVEIK